VDFLRLRPKRYAVFFGGEVLVIRKGGFLVLLLLVMVLGAAVGFGASKDEIQNRIDQTKKKLSETKRREKTVLNSLLKTQKELEDINDDLTKLNYSLNKTERNMAITQSQLNNAQSTLQQIKTEIGGREGVLDQRLIAIYKYGYQSSLEILFNSRNFAEFIARFEMVSAFVRADIHILKTLHIRQDLISRKQIEITAKKKELEIQRNTYSRLQDQTKQQQKRRTLVLHDRQKELTVLQNDRKVLEESLDELERISREMEAQIRDLQNKNRVALGSGKYIWPLQSKGSISSYFGYRFHPILRKRKYHSGIDLPAPSGLSILAADSGVVVFAGWNNGYGKMVILDHGAGFSTVYGHCSIIQVNQGQTVTKGQNIAQVGSTGLSTGPHLHFEVRKNGVAVDPLTYLGQ
jgi:murein DD-endopeptidase MepM/ murein hydrolase activator NlpD